MFEPYITINGVPMPKQEYLKWRRQKMAQTTKGIKSKSDSKRKKKHYEKFKSDEISYSIL